jgi:hypothetical protein
LQNWWGAVITPKAQSLIEKYCAQFPSDLANADRYLRRENDSLEKRQQGNVNNKIAG